jgi:hypothetical protein
MTMLYKRPRFDEMESGHGGSPPLVERLARKRPLQSEQGESTAPATMNTTGIPTASCGTEKRFLPWRLPCVARTRPAAASTVLPPACSARSVNVPRGSPQRLSPASFLLSFTAFVTWLYCACRVLSARAAPPGLWSWRVEQRLLRLLRFYGGHTHRDVFGGYCIC